MRKWEANNAKAKTEGYMGVLSHHRLLLTNSPDDRLDELAHMNVKSVALRESAEEREWDEITRINTAGDHQMQKTTRLDHHGGGGQKQVLS